MSAAGRTSSKTAALPIQDDLAASRPLGSLQRIDLGFGLTVAVAAVGQRLRGENAVDGFSYGKIAELANGARGTDVEGHRGELHNAIQQTAGLAYPVEVLSVDDYWNHVPDAPGDLIYLFTTDNTAQIIPQNNNLVEGEATFSVTLNQGGNQILRALDDSNPTIQTSLDAQVWVLVGGLHYVVTLGTSSVAAGDPFDMSIAFRNGNDEIVISANHLITLSLEDATNLTPVEGDLQYVSINLQNGIRTLTQTCNAVLAPAVDQRACPRWSLSSLTLPHGLARVVVAEALYRAVSVVKGLPYHRP